MSGGRRVEEGEGDSLGCGSWWGNGGKGKGLPVRLWRICERRFVR